MVNWIKSLFSRNEKCLPKVRKKHIRITPEIESNILYLHSLGHKPKDIYIKLNISKSSVYKIKG